MDWSQELVKSLIWLGEAFVLVCIGSVIVGGGVVRYTRWGRQVWQLTWPYFNPAHAKKPLLMVLLLLFLDMFSVRMNVLFSFWYNGFYSALQATDQKAFWFLLGIFSLLATVHVARSLISEFVEQAFDIYWRTWLNNKMVADWLEKGAFYRGQFLDSPVDNPDQRIQVDASSFVTSTRTLFIGAADSVVSLVAFSAILWELSGPLAIAGIELPRAMVFLVYLYVIVASVFAFKLGRPLIALSFINEKLSANFRYALMRLREYAESIAFYKGEHVESNTLTVRFAQVIGNTWDILFRSLKFDGFNLVVSQVAVVFPFILQAPRFFSGALKLGDVMQTAQAFGQVQDALSFFRTKYDSFAAYRATLDRLTGFDAANQAARELPTVTTAEIADAIEIDHLDLFRPGGGTMLHDLNLRLAPGQTLLVKGASGAGKTSLLRAIAGLWPYAEGAIKRPTGTEALFLSQRPYLPLGNLRTAAMYPAVEMDDEAIRAALHKVQLGQLEDRLDEGADWSRILSLGEQQRLAFARILLNRPRVAFLDEATSATDEGLEYALYELLRNELPQCILVSVGHRSTLDRFHTHRLDIKGGGAWTFAESAPGA